jgi:hypothetical protein
MVRKLPEWPGELKKPIVIRNLLSGLDSSLPRSEYIDQAKDKLGQAVLIRLALLCKFFGPSIPKTDEEWLSLIIKLCDYWDIPGFKRVVENPPSVGARKKWTDQRLCELFSDVKALGSEAKLTEHSACVFIANNVDKFGQRYSLPRNSTRDRWAKTLHRQFVEAKAKAKSDWVFRFFYFNPGGERLASVPEYGPKLIKLAIERYAVTRKSKG